LAGKHDYGYRAVSSHLEPVLPGLNVKTVVRGLLNESLSLCHSMISTPSLSKASFAVEWLAGKQSAWLIAHDAYCAISLRVVLVSTADISMAGLPYASLVPTAYCSIQFLPRSQYDN
jgi:hypothetical protein